MIYIQNISGEIKQLNLHEFEINETLVIDSNWFNDEVISAVVNGDFLIKNQEDSLVTISDQLSHLKGSSLKLLIENTSYEKRLWFNYAFDPHNARHASGGDDELSVEGLFGRLGENQPFDQGEISGLPENQLQLNHPTHSNANDPSTSQKQAMDAAQNPSTTNPFVTNDWSTTTHYSKQEVTDFLNLKEDAIAISTPTRYWRGDKTWQNLNKQVVGLSNVDNTSDANKPISNAVQTALNDKYDASNPNNYESSLQLNDRDTQNRSRSNHTGTQTTSTISDFEVSVQNNYQVSLNTTHRGRTDNPHSVTKSQIGLANVDNTSDLSKPISTATQTALNLKVNSSEKGSINGVATLGSDGKIPSTQLPSFVDDVLEFATLGSFPTTGESGKIYIALNTNLTYRWGGTVYVLISSSLALGETSSTAYRGDRGAIAYDHSQIVTGNPHHVTKSDVGLSNVTNNEQLNKADNLADLPSKATARTNLELGTSAIRNVGVASNQVASGDHSHILQGLTDVPPYPATGAYQLKVTDGILSWELASSVTTAKRTFTWQVHNNNSSCFSTVVGNEPYFKRGSNSNLSGSDDGWRSHNVYPIIIPFGLKVKKIILVCCGASFDNRASSGNLYLQLGFYSHRHNGTDATSLLNFTIAGAYSGNSLTDNTSYYFVSEDIELSSGTCILNTGCLVGVKFRKDQNVPGQIHTLVNPVITLVCEEV